MNRELTEKIAKTRLIKEFEKRPDNIVNFLQLRGAESLLNNASTVQEIRNELGLPAEVKGRFKNPTKEMLTQEVDKISRHGKTLNDIKEAAKTRLDENKVRNDVKSKIRLSKLGELIKNNPGKTTAITTIPLLATGTILASKAHQNRKALKQNEDTDKTASFHYEEMVKFAYEDIIGSFEKSAEENNSEEKAKAEQKKEMMKRLAAASALTAGATFGGAAIYKKISNSSNYYPKVRKFRGNIDKVIKKNPVVKLRNDEWEVVGTNTNPVKLTPLLSAAN